jgi:hypothetical protein
LHQLAGSSVQAETLFLQKVKAKYWKRHRRLKKLPRETVARQE